MRHNPRCAIFREPPTLQDPNDCNCGAIPSLPPSVSLGQAISEITRRKQNLDHIYEAHRNSILVKHKEEELDRVLEILSQVRP